MRDLQDLGAAVEAMIANKEEYQRVCDGKDIEQISVAWNHFQRSEMAVRHTAEALRLYENEGREVHCPCSACVEYADATKKELS